MGILTNLLSNLSGNRDYKVSDQLLFDKVIGFKGLSAGVGTSTLVQGVAVALSENSNYSIVVIDASFLSPTLPHLLGSGETKSDFLSFNGELGEIVASTSYRNVSLLSLNRYLSSMFSSDDNKDIVTKLIASLKTHFDVILIDLPNELTTIATEFAIRSNKIIAVADESVKCVANLKKTLNNLGTLAVPLGKVSNVILNKQVPNVVSGTKTAMKEAGLMVIGEIPLSIPIATLGLTGKPVYMKSSADKTITTYGNVVDTLLLELFQTTPLNAKYTDKAEVEKEKKSWFARGKKPQEITSAPIRAEVTARPSSSVSIDEDEDIAD